MARNTPNFVLRVWDDLMDRFNHTELAANWDKLDAHDHTGATKGLKITNGALVDDAVDARVINDALKSPAVNVEGLRSLGTGATQAMPGDTIISLAQLQTAIQQALCPVGSLMPYAGNTSPAGWLICDGAPVSRTGTYAALFAAISTTWGNGNGTTTFNLPDLRGRTFVGATAAVNAGAPALGGGLSTRTLASLFGNETVTLSTAQMPSHAHPVSESNHSHVLNDPQHAHSVSPTGANLLNVNSNGTAFNAGGTGNSAATGVANMWKQNYGTDLQSTGITMNGATTGLTVQNSGGDGAHNNLQPSAVGNWLIKY